MLPFAGLSEPPERIAILGNAAGTTARAYGHYFPDTVVDGVEIDGELTEIGRRFFDLDNPNLRVHHEDARPWLRVAEGGYDVIMVDAYRQPYIPFYLATEEFFELVRDRLAPGGVVIVNAGHPEGNDDLEKTLGRTMAEVFPTEIRDPIEPTNTLLLGSEAPASGARLREAVRDLLPGSAVATQSAARITRVRGRQGLHGRPRAGRVVDRPLDPRIRGGGLRLEPTRPVPRLARHRAGGRFVAFFLDPARRRSVRHDRRIWMSDPTTTHTDDAWHVAFFTSGARVLKVRRALRPRAARSRAPPGVRGHGDRSSRV